MGRGETRNCHVMDHGIVRMIICHEIVSRSMASRPFSKMHGGDECGHGIAAIVVGIFAAAVVVLLVDCNRNCRHVGVRYRQIFVLL